MQSSRRVTKNATATKKYKVSSDSIMLLFIISIFGMLFINIIVGNQLTYDSSMQVVVTDKGVAIQPPLPHYLEKILPIEDEVYSGEEIAKFLSGELSFPPHCGGDVLTGRCRLKFRPGTLPLTSTQTLQQCYVDTEKYKSHMRSSSDEFVSTSISHTHRLIYHNIPKSASSTGRHAMFDFLEGKEYSLPFDTMMKLVTHHNYTMISFIREPLTRFYSSYDEAYFRMGPWMAEGEVVRNQPNLRKHYQSIKYKVDKYPYLYEGMKTIRDFRKMYCPQEVLDAGIYIKCDEYDSIDDGRLLRRFERFVNDYDGIEPFDIHLNMQTTNLIYETGKPLPLSDLYSASNAEKDWQDVARQRGVTIPDGNMTHGRHQSRRFDVSKVSEATQQKICQILALDYCCLNFELPKVCDDIGLYCSLEQMEGARMWKEDVSLNLVIRPWDK